MKLYYYPGACSLAPHIVLLETGTPFSAVKTDIKNKKTESGADYLKINPKGAVPALELDGGEVLTEGAVILQYLADLKPDSGLAARAGTLERYHLMEMLNYIASEVHKGFSPLFNPAASEELKKMAFENLRRKFDYLAPLLAAHPYLMGERFTVADAYLFTVLAWTRPLKIDLAPWPALGAYLKRVRERPAVEKALKAEGLG